MNKKTITIVSVILILATLGIAVYAVAGADDFFSIGEFYRKAIEGQEIDKEVVAIYKENEILRSAVEYMRQMNVMRDKQEAARYETDRDIINRIIENMIIVEEAERRGLAATDAEIEEMIKAAKLTYEIPEGKKLLDSYCEGAGITIDEYYDILREQAPRTIARQKLRDEIGREYCKENGIEFTKINPPAEMVEAIDKYIAELFAANEKYIKYFI